MPSRMILAAIFVAALAVPAAVTAQTKVKVLHAFGFVPADSETVMAVIGNHRYLQGSTPIASRHLHASLDLPEGAAIAGLSLEGCNFADSGGLFATIYVVDSTTGDATQLPDENGVPIAGGAECTEETLLFDGPTYLPRENSYYVRVRMQSGSAEHRFRAVRVYYTLQVAPASVPTFNDVPESDPAFQFIEALVRSGITVGCGGDNYCPDNPVTRRQMAVFLAKGLGLGWPVN
jgi:S-layer homology domain